MTTQLMNEEDSENLIRLRLTTYNARLVDTRKGRGITGEVMAQMINMPRYRFGLIETLKRLPTEDEMVRIACALEKPIDYLFPEDIVSAFNAGLFSRRKVELAGPQISALTRQQELITDGGLSEIEENLDRQNLVKDLVKILLPKEAHLMDLRFGLTDGRSRTLEEVGKDFGVTRERIRQMEASALRKLRQELR